MSGKDIFRIQRLMRGCSRNARIGNVGTVDILRAYAVAVSEWNKIAPNGFSYYFSFHSACMSIRALLLSQKVSLISFFKRFRCSLKKHSSQGICVEGACSKGGSIEGQVSKIKEGPTVEYRFTSSRRGMLLYISKFLIRCHVSKIALYIYIYIYIYILQSEDFY